MKEIIKIEFDDLEKFFKAGETSKVCIGRSKEKDKVPNAIKKALAMHDIKAATKVMVVIIGDPEIDINEITKCGYLVRKTVNSNCEIVFGVNIDEALNNEAQVIIIATE